MIERETIAVGLARLNALRARGGAPPLAAPRPGVAAGEPAVASINHGRWLAECPCGSAEKIDPDEALFYCFACQNVAAGGRVRRVLVPPEAPAIEAELAHRRAVATRNWSPGETLAALAAETAALEGRLAR